MDLNLYECPECGWKGNFTPNECPVCGHNLVEHRANIKAEMRKEVQEAAERQKLEELEEEYREAIQLFNDGCLGDARVAFMALGDYKDSAKFAKECKDGIYQILVREFNKNEFLENLVSQEETVEYFDTPFVQKCIANYSKYGFSSLSDDFMRLNGYKQSQEYMDYCDKAVKLFELYASQEVEHKKYTNAVSLYNNGQYEEAIAAFKKIENLRDSKEYVIRCQGALFQQALKTMKTSYKEALEEVKKIPYVKDTSLLEDLKKEHTSFRYRHALIVLESGKYESALFEFKNTPENKEDPLYSEFIAKYNAAILRCAQKELDSGHYQAALRETEKLLPVEDESAHDDFTRKCYEAQYQHALRILEDGQYDVALRTFEKLPQSKDPVIADDFAKKYNKVLLQYAQKELDTGHYQAALKETEKLLSTEDKSNYDDFMIKYYEALYHRALQMLESGNYEAALKEFLKLPQSKDEAVSDEFAEKYHMTIFQHAQGLYLSHDYVTALEEVKKIPLDAEHPLFVDLKEKCIEKLYRTSLEKFENKNYEEALRGFQKIPEYKDSSDYIVSAQREIEHIELMEYVDELNRETEREEKELKKNKWLRVLHIPIYFLNLLSCLGLGVILFLHKDQISLYSNFWWWLAGWAVIALISYSTFGNYMREAFRKPGTPKFKIHKNAPKTALIMIALYLVAALVVIWRFGNWF